MAAEPEAPEPGAGRDAVAENGKISVGTAIDLSALGLDTIEETDTEFAIGAMATLRSLETHAALNAATNGAMREAVRHIVGCSSATAPPWAAACTGGLAFQTY